MEDITVIIYRLSSIDDRLQLKRAFKNMISFPVYKLRISNHVRLDRALSRWRFCNSPFSGDRLRLRRLSLDKTVQVSSNASTRIVSSNGAWNGQGGNALIPLLRHPMSAQHRNALDFPGALHLGRALTGMVHGYSLRQGRTIARVGVP